MKYFLIALFIALSYSVNSQNIPIDELVNLRDKGIGAVEEHLSKKGWTYFQSKTGDFGELDTSTFSYSKSEFNNKAESFITYIYSDLSETKRIQIQVNKIEIYNQIIDRIKAYGCKFVESKLDEGNLIKYYQGKTTTFEIMIGTLTNEFGSKNSVYSIKILSNTDYQTNY